MFKDVWQYFIAFLTLWIISFGCWIFLYFYKYFRYFSWDTVMLPENSLILQVLLLKSVRWKRSSDQSMTCYSCLFRWDLTDCSPPCSWVMRFPVCLVKTDAISTLGEGPTLILFVLSDGFFIYVFWSSLSWTFWRDPLQFSRGLSLYTSLRVATPFCKTIKHHDYPPGCSVAPL